MPALQAHVELFGRAPRLAAADRGFWNSANEKTAADLGVKQVVLPGRGRLSPSRAARQKQRWFRRGQGWRAGIEARLSTLKHRFGMQRALYKGEIGFERYVGWCIIAHNLMAMSRARRKSVTRHVVSWDLRQSISWEKRVHCHIVSWVLYRLRSEVLAASDQEAGGSRRSC